MKPLTTHALSQIMYFLRWGDPPPKGLEKEHYDHNFGQGGHKFGKGYDGKGHVGGGHGGHGGGHGGHGGHGGGGGGQGGWGWKKVEHYPHGWYVIQKFFL